MSRGCVSFAVVILDRGPRPVQTLYKGYRFRSRLEARWAVFFDHAEIPYEYEAEGFDLGAAGYYLPDFWLPGSREWIEVKPTDPLPGESAKAAALSSQIPDGSAMILAGQPWHDPPSQPEYSFWVRYPNGEELIKDTDVRFLRCFGCHRVIIADVWWGSLYHCEHCDMVVRPEPGVVGPHGWHWHEGDWVHDRENPYQDPRLSRRVLDAYAAARSARFEHGESG